MRTVLKVKDITKIYSKGQKPSLDRVSFEVDEGEFIGIMGASGSGKTTLLNVLSTIDKATNGEVFATFLHDEVLQDLLSVKNMTGKINRPEVQKIIYDTLDNLNVHIRNQMQDYHPIILKSLTYRENLDNLIEGIAEIFPNKVIKTSFECSSNLFVAEPYDILIYRWIKELFINFISNFRLSS